MAGVLSWRNRKVRGAFSKTIVYILLIILGAFFAFPLVWLISTSLKPPTQVFVFPPQWIPKPFKWDNYPVVIREMKFWEGLKNSGILAAGIVSGTLISCSLVAYSFARLEWPGRDFLFIVLLATMMVPFTVTMIPIYIVFMNLRWLNSFKPLIVPAFLGNAFFIFLLRQFFLTIPFELSDAAKIDGCSEFGILWRIILPLAKPALAVVAIFSFINAWDAFIGPLIYLSDNTKYPLVLKLHGLQAGGTVVVINWNTVMAGATLVIAPILILFFFTQKYFIEGITLTGLKG
jgi:ABC-type glycerol-3-phosphate transport system permease component